MVRKFLKSHVTPNNKPISINVDEKEKFTITNENGDEVESADLPAKVEVRKFLFL